MLIIAPLPLGSGLLALSAMLAPPPPPLHFDPPTPPSQTFLVQAGQTLAFDVNISDDDPTQVIKFFGQGPIGSTLTPALPLFGNPLSTHLSWTPTAANVGTQPFGFRADDDNGKVGRNYKVTVLPPPVCTSEDAIGSNFNGTAIPAGRTVWFNAIVKVNGLDSMAATLSFRNAHITFTAGNTNYDVAMPDTLILVSSTATAASIVYDPVTNQWIETVPASYSGNIFLAGAAFPLTTSLPGGINPVSWSGVFGSTKSGVSFQWKWAAAVYTNFSTDYNALQVKPIDGSSSNPYPNSDHAGTPEAFKSFVTGGARGGGGSNFTGSYSGTHTTGCE